MTSLHMFSIRKKTGKKIPDQKKKAVSSCRDQNIRLQEIFCWWAIPASAH